MHMHFSIELNVHEGRGVMATPLCPPLWAQRDGQLADVLVDLNRGRGLRRGPLDREERALRRRIHGGGGNLSPPKRGSGPKSKGLVEGLALGGKQMCMFGPPKYDGGSYPLQRKNTHNNKRGQNRMFV